MRRPLRLNFFYGWYILAACFFLLFFQAGARFSFGIMFKPMMAELGWNRASISLVFFLNMVCFALTLSIAGKLYDRWGPRGVIFVSTLFLSVGYGSISFISTLWEFHLYYGILAAIGMGGASVPLIAALMSKWFEHNRGLVISLALSGNCIGQFVLVPLFSDLVSRFGWRTSCVIIAACIFVVNTILALFVIKGQPGDFELTPRGRQHPAANQALGSGIGNLPQGGDGVGMGVPAYDQFRHQGGVGQGKGDDEIDQQESGAAVAGSLGRKAPDIAEPDGAARRRHNEAET